MFRVHREHDDDFQQAVLDESRRLEGLIASYVAAIKEMHSNIDYARQQRDAEMSILKGQHEAEKDNQAPEYSCMYMCKNDYACVCVHVHVCV